MSAPSKGTEEIRRRVEAKWRELAGIARDFSDQCPSRNSVEHLAMARFASEVETEARRAQIELYTGRCAYIRAASVFSENARSRITWLWGALVGFARFARRYWPWQGSLWHTVIAQFELEAEQTWRASAEKRGRA